MRVDGELLVVGAGRGGRQCVVRPLEVVEEDPVSVELLCNSAAAAKFLRNLQL